MVPRYRAGRWPITWCRLRRGLFGLREKPAPAEVIDLSVDGALVLGPFDRNVRRGSVVPIEHAGARGLVQVRHVHDAPDPKLRFYGVQFVHLQPELRSLVHDLVAARRGDGGQIEQVWSKAR
jgi:hypothetical protein